MNNTTIIPIDNIDAYNKMYGFETLHPLVSVVDLAEATKMPNHVACRYGVYALWLKDGIQCSLHYDSSILRCQSLPRRKKSWSLCMTSGSLFFITFPV